MDKSQIKGFIAARVAKELKDGDVVNLGIGLPTLVPNYLPEGVKVTLQSENGIVGTGTVNDNNRDPLYVTDAGGAPAAVAPGGAFIDSCSSFGLIRGGHVDATVLAQRPKLAPHIPAMRANLARRMGVEPGRVNVKATTEEKLGFTGSGEGMAAHAVCLLEEG